MGSIPFFAITHQWNQDVLGTYDLSGFERVGDDQVTLAQGNELATMILYKISQSPNFFAVLKKRHYYDTLLRFKDLFDPILDEDKSWLWRFSPKISNDIFKVLVYLKFEPWQEALNALLLKIKVTQSFSHN